MQHERLLTQWILEALGVVGPSARPLQVAKRVWAHHEEDLRASGDLFFTWQLDLQATARVMAQNDTLVLTPRGEWALPDGVTTTPSPRGRAWDPAAIATVVEAYLEVLQAEHSGRPTRPRDLVGDLLARTGRGAGQVEQLLANVTAVLQEHGVEPLAAFPPRSNVPVGVRPEVAQALERLRAG